MKKKKISASIENATKYSDYVDIKKAVEMLT